MDTKRSGKQGFASMTPERMREVASSGGRAAHEKGTGHEWTSEEAREAGRKGGKARAARRAAGSTPTPSPAQKTPSTGR
jgi:general stress protein YciG